MKKSVKRNSDIVILSGIFALVLIYFLSLITSYKYVGTPLENNDYATFWYPLYNTLSQLVFAVILTLKAYRLGACVFTKIATHLWSSLIILGLIYILFFNYYSIFLTVLAIAFIASIIITIIVFILKLCLKK